MLGEENKISRELDTLDFRLQKSKGSVIVTVLINQVPLYDCIIQKQAKFNFTSKKEKNEFLLESYCFDNFPDQEIDEEELFLHNFPQNLSPIDYKHPMIGLGVCFTYYALVCPHSETEMFYLKDKKIPENEFDDIYFDKKKQLIICLGQSTPKNRLMPTLEIRYGANFIRIGKMFCKLFKNEKTKYENLIGYSDFKKIVPMRVNQLFLPIL